MTVAAALVCYCVYTHEQTRTTVFAAPLAIMRTHAKHTCTLSTRRRTRAVCNQILMEGDWVDDFRWGRADKQTHAHKKRLTKKHLKKSPAPPIQVRQRAASVCLQMSLPPSSFHPFSLSFCTFLFLPSVFLWLARLGIARSLRAAKPESTTGWQRWAVYHPQHNE